VTAGSDRPPLLISSRVFQQFQNQDAFGSGVPDSVGMLFGSVDEAGQSHVHYAPSFLPQISTSLKVQDYVYGRYEASFETVYYLFKWMSLGYWVAYEGDEQSPDRLFLALLARVGGELSLPESVLVTLRRTPRRPTELRAYTRVPSGAVTVWQELEPIGESRSTGLKG
jgi:hypothetical protein